jgi:hypothetical protein
VSVEGSPIWRVSISVPIPAIALTHVLIGRPTAVVMVAKRHPITGSNVTSDKSTAERTINNELFRIAFLLCVPVPTLTAQDR